MEMVPSYGGEFKSEPQWRRQRYWLEDIHNQVLVSAYYARSSEEINLINRLELSDAEDLWIDSGGYTMMTKGIGALDQIPGRNEKKSWRDLEETIKSEQREIIRFQENQNADVAFTFDIPIKPDTPEYAKDEFIRLTKQNARLALRESKDTATKIYPVVQSWDFDSARKGTLFYENYGFDGVGVGGLVPYAKNIEKRIEILLGVRSVTDRPIHALGATAIHHLYAMAALGVDSLDSQTYANYANYRHFILPQTGQRKCIGENVKTETQYRFKHMPCACPYCCEANRLQREGELRFASQYYGQSGSEAAAKLAKHNLITMLNEINLINSAMEGGWFDKLLRKRREENSSINRVINYIEEKASEHPEIENQVNFSIAFG